MAAQNSGYLKGIHAYDSSSSDSNDASYIDHSKSQKVENSNHRYGDDKWKSLRVTEEDGRQRGQKGGQSSSRRSIGEEERKSHKKKKRRGKHSTSPHRRPSSNITATHVDPGDDSPVEVDIYSEGAPRMSSVIEAVTTEVSTR